ncbi:hypothetical protein [Actinokineospora iranica]|uniref:Uncharacterized protein n=1 Tax=Actinokineospora iranica TaxID=1271860 RepID=A0A1G6IVD3_9PSEU|nr:hypothetical protein [Actinokineospora iranica]SDC10469.1 hypothetical protein SAMN05216174_101117 [Actinokineospora iranica]
MEYLAAGALLLVGLVVLAGFLVGLLRRVGRVRGAVVSTSRGVGDRVGLLRARLAALRVAVEARKAKSDS